MSSGTRVNPAGSSASAPPSSTNANPPSGSPNHSNQAFKSRREEKEAIPDAHEPSEKSTVSSPRRANNPSAVLASVDSHLAACLQQLQVLPNVSENCKSVCSLLGQWVEKFKALDAHMAAKAPQKDSKSVFGGDSPTLMTPNPQPLPPQSHQVHSWADAVKAAAQEHNFRSPRIARSPKKTPEEIRETAEARHVRAEEARRTTLTSRIKKARVSVERVKEVNERLTQLEQTKQIQRQTLIEVSQRRADERREQQVQQIKTKAENEIQKVKESRISSTNSLNDAAESAKKKKQQMEERLQEAENRRRAQEEEKKRISQELANPRSITPEERFKRICKYCNAEIRLSEPISTHLISKRHLSALKLAGINVDSPSSSLLITGSFAENCVIKVPLFPVVHNPPSEDELREARQHQESRKRKAKKIKQKLVALASDQQEKVTQPQSASPGISSPQKPAAHLQKYQRVFLDLKDQLTKRHNALLESTLQKLHSLFLSRTPVSSSAGSVSSPNSFQASGDSVFSIMEHTKGLSVLMSVLSSYTPTSGLQGAVERSLQILLLLLKDESFRRYFILSNQMIPVVSLIISAEKHETFLTPALKATALCLRWPRSPQSPQDDSNSAIWSMTLLNISYALNASLLEKVRLLLIQQENLQSSNTREFGLFIETVRLISNMTAFVRIELDRLRRQVGVNVEEWVTRLEQLTVELTSALKDTHFVGVLSHLASVLLQDGPLHKSKKRLSRDVHFLSFCIVELLKSIGMFNLPVLQAFLGGSSYEQVEFFHVANYLLTQLGSEEMSDSDSSTDGSSTSTSSAGASKQLGTPNRKKPGASVVPLVPLKGNADNKIEATRADLLQALLELIGLCCLQNPANQAMMLWGQSPNLLQRLLSLPFSYYSMKPQRIVLFPTLIAVCLNDRRNLAILQQEVSQDMLIEFLDDLLEGRFDAAELVVIERRLPRSLWRTAHEFFSGPAPEPEVEANATIDRKSLESGTSNPPGEEHTNPESPVMVPTQPNFD